MIGIDLDVKRGFFAVLRRKVGWDRSRMYHHGVGDAAGIVRNLRDVAGG